MTAMRGILITPLTLTLALAGMAEAGQQPGGPSTPGPAGPNRPRAAAPAPQDEVVRTYDVRALGLAPRKAVERSPVRFLPSLDIVGPFEDEAGSEDLNGLGGGELVNLLVDLVGPSAESAGRGLAVSERGQLIVTGPASLHSQVEGLLQLVGHVATSETRLAVDVVPLPVDAAFALQGVLLSAADGAALAARGTHHFEVTLRDDVGGSYDAVRAVPVLLDYDVEVAGSAAIADPMVRVATAGTRFAALAAPGVGGVHLALTLKRTELSLGRRSNAIEVLTRHVGDDGRAHSQTNASLVEDPTWTSTSFATSCFLPDERALCLVGATRDGATEVLVVRAVGAHSPSLVVVPFQDGGVAALLHLGALEPPVVGVEGRLFESGLRIHRRFSATGLDEQNGSESLLSTRLRLGRSDAPRDFVTRALGRGFDTWELGPWVALRGDARLEALGDTVAALERAAHGTTLQVDVRVERDGEWLRRARYPVRLGDTSALTLTNEALDSIDTDVEIAERSMCSDPILMHVFDGLVACLRPLPLDDGRLLLQTFGAAQVMGPRTAKAQQAETVLEERSIEQLDLRARQVLTRGADGAYRAVLGGTQGGALSVVIELR